MILKGPSPNLLTYLNLKHEPFWLDQIHGNRIIHTSDENRAADGVWTQDKIPCAIKTADCLPVLLCDTKGTVVSAIHAGWRGLASGVIENAVHTILPHAEGEIIAWFGPAIGPQCFEVGEEVRDAFLSKGLENLYAFKLGNKPGKYLADIYHLARIALMRVGVTKVYGGEFCTYSDPDHFYSYRRGQKSERMQILIWLNHTPI